MIRMTFWGYGGEYAIGKLTDVEVNNISKLVKNFEYDFILDNYEICFDPNEYRTQFHDFNDAYQSWNLNSGRFSVTDENDEEIGEYDFGDIDYEDTKVFEFPEQGYYLCSSSSEKGTFFEIELDIPSDEWDINKLEIKYDNLDIIWNNETIISAVLYDGKELEMNFDVASTTGKGFYQSLVFIDENFDIYYDGLDEIETDRYFDYRFDDPADEYKNEIMIDYLNIYEFKSVDEIHTPFYFHIPAMYDALGKEKTDELLFDKEQFRKAKYAEMVTVYPKHILDKIESEKPEWLI